MRFNLLITLSLIVCQFATTAQAKTVVKLGSDPKKLLAMTADAEPLRGKNPEYFIRGVIKSSQDLGGNQYKLLILPIEVLGNRQHYVNADRFREGVESTVAVNKTKQNVKVGNVVELNQYYIIHEEGKGNAKLIALEYRQEFQAYPISSAPYLAKDDLFPEQKLNALYGIALYPGTFKDVEKVKTDLEKLSSNKDSEIAKLAKSLVGKIK